MRPILGCLSLTLIALSGCGLFDGGSSRQQSLLDDNTDDPADPACAELDEASCLARSDCEATYVGVGCACPDCAPGTDCPPCDCDPNPVEQFAGCVDRDPCEGLDEQTCVATEGCQPNYGVAPCPLGPCIENPEGTVDCPPCDDTSEYLGCSSAPVDPCNGLSEEECLSTDGCAPIYGAEDGRTDPGQPSDPNDPTSPVPPPPQGYLGCYSVPPPSICEGLSEDECAATPECEAEYLNPCTQVCDDSGQCYNCGPDGACHPIGEECNCDPIYAGCHGHSCGGGTEPVPGDGR